MFGPEKTTGIGATSIILIILILFVKLLRRGLQRRRLTRVYYTCAEQRRQNPAFSVEQLALVLRRPLDSVKKDLDTIMQMGFTDPVNINNKNYNQQSQNYRTEKPRLEPNTIPNTKSFNEPKLDEYVEVNCKNCGASNRILKGSAVNCEYCGSMMKWK
jgi:DNA-directed RNA polymerase subunit RPC12/RpoP